MAADGNAFSGLLRTINRSDDLAALRAAAGQLDRNGPKRKPSTAQRRYLATEVPNRLDAVDVPHLRRCLAAGLLEVTKTKALRITPAGRSAIAGVEPFKGPPGKNPSQLAKAGRKGRYAATLLARRPHPVAPKGRRALLYPPIPEVLHLNPSDAFGIPEGAHLVPVRGTKMPKPGPKLDGPAKVYAYIRDLHRSPVERFLVILLDNNAKSIGVVIISQGTLVSTDVHPREVFAPAISARSAAILVVHNHPSSGPGSQVHASDADVEVTKRLIDVGLLVGVSVQDHVVIGADSFVSLRQEQPDLWLRALRCAR